MGSGFGISSAVTGAINSAVDAYKKNSEIMDTSEIESSIDDISSRELNYGNFDSLMSDYGSYNPAYTGYSMQDLRGQSYGKMALTTLANTGQAALNGMASTGSPYGLLAGVPALAAGVGGIFAGNSKASSKADELNRQGEYANAMYTKNFANNASNIRNDMFNKAALNMKAFGGKVSPFVKSRLLSSSFKMKPRKMKYGGFGHYYAYGGDMSGEWTNGVTEINEGGTHEMNEYGGVPIGLDMNGTPNLVEEGEVVFNDYVYSNRLKPTQKQLDSVKLNTKYKGKTYAEIAKDLQRESSSRPLDPISKNTLVDSMSKLTAIQEESRQFEMMKQFVEQLQQMTPEEQIGLMQNVPMEAMGQSVGNEDISSIPFGSQEGFTPDNRRAYRGIQEEMNEGMIAPEEQMALGGFVNIGADGMPLKRQSESEYYFDNPEIVSMQPDNTRDVDWLYYLENLPYDNNEVDEGYLPGQTPINVSYLRDRLAELLNGKDVNGLPYTDKFKYFNNGKYDDDYVDFVNNFKFDTNYGQAVYDELAKIYKERTGKALDINKAKSLGLDNKFGVFHDAWAAAKDYNPSAIPDYVALDPNIDLGITEEQIANDAINYGDETPLKVDVLKSQKVSSKYPGVNGMQFAPAVGSAIGAINSLFEKPEYTAADYIARGRRGIRDVRGRAIGNYLTYNPYDINYAANNLAQISLGATRGINNTAANAGQAIAGTLMQNANLMKQMGDLRMKAREYNDQQRRAVADFNRQTDLQNAQFGQQADIQNSNLDLQRANLLAQEGQLREAANTAISQRRSAALTNLFNNIGNVGTTKYNADKAQWLFDMGYIPNAAKSCGGKIRRKKRLLK